MGNFIPYLTSPHPSISESSSTSIYSIYKTPFVIKEIVTKAQDVSINIVQMKLLASLVIDFMIQNFQHGTFEAIGSKSWRHKFDQFFYTVENSKIFDLLFVMNALNFSLWISRSSKQWTVNGLSGYEALKAALLRAVTEGRLIYDPHYYSQITYSEVEYIFRSDDTEISIPLIHERVFVLHEIGTVLLNKYKGTFRNCLLQCQGDEHKLLFLLFNEFQSYRDKAKYDITEVCLGSKAISLVGDLNYFRQIHMDINSITFMVFTDFYGPEVLLHSKILQYSGRLKNKIQNNELLEYGSKEELEIRCCSIHAIKMLINEVTLLCETFKDEMYIIHTPRYCMPTLIDNFLQHYKKMNNNVTCHNIRSIYY